MKRSPFKHKHPDPQAQLKAEHKLLKMRERALGIKGRSRSGARGQYFEDEWIPSQWELACRKQLRWMEKAGKVENLRKEVVTFVIYNAEGTPKVLQMEIDLCFFHKDLNRECRWDAKPPKVVHTKWGRRYPQKLHAEWLFKFELLKFCQPNYDYRILEKGRVTELDF